MSQGGYPRVIVFSLVLSPGKQVKQRSKGNYPHFGDAGTIAWKKWVLAAWKEK